MPCIQKCQWLKQMDEDGWFIHTRQSSFTASNSSTHPDNQAACGANLQAVDVD